VSADISAVALPQPFPNVDTDGFWQATAQGEVRLCRCQDCRTWMQPPLERCRACAGPTAFEAVAGTGTVFSFIVVRHAAVQGFEVPYVVTLVEFDDQPGLRLSARLVDIDPPDVRIGQTVAVGVADHPGGSFRVLVFRPTHG